LQEGKSLMPMIPADAFGTTASDSPTWFWYVPATTARTAELRLLDSNDNNLYTTTFKLTGSPGMVGFTLPRNALSKPLEVGESYRWQFTVLCNVEEPSKNPFVEGTLQKVTLNPTLISQLKQAPLRDRPALYAQAGIWHDAIATLAQQQCTSPQDSSWQSRWTTLLQSVQLDRYATEPLPQVCATGSTSITLPQTSR
jgi:hypothetical protein